jgi:hypothetical protein
MGLDMIFQFGANLDEVAELIVGRAFRGALRAVPATGARQHWDRHPGRRGVFFGVAPP